MTGLTLIIVCAALVAIAFGGVVVMAVRYASRREVQFAFAQPHGPRAVAFARHLADVRLMAGMIRAVGGVVLVVALLRAYDEPGSGLGETLWPSLLAGLLFGVLGVVAPQALAVRRGLKVLVALAPMLLGLRVAFLPLIVVLRPFALASRRLTERGRGRTEDEDGEMPAEQAVKAEILQVASDGQAQGAVDREEMRMLESALAFGDLRTAEVMTPRVNVVAVPVEATQAEARQAVAQSGHSRLPVYDGDIDNIIGIIHAKDLLAADPAAEVRRIMRQPTFVPETKRLDELLRELRVSKVHMVIVLDEFGGTAGVVTLEDMLEEIVGEIGDEHDRPVSPLLKRIDERTAEVDGRIRIDDLNRALAIELPEGPDYDTLAGLMTTQLGFIPPVGEMLNVGRVSLTVSAADARRISRVKVETAPEEA